VPLLHDMSRVMQSFESPSGLTHSNIGSHIFKTLDDGRIGLILIDMVMVAQRWEGSQHPGLYTPRTIMHWMEDIAQGDDWRTHRDDIHSSTPWMLCSTPWTLALFDDDVTH
jgi:hypothetical protein